jgi:hypothetical protein
MIQGSAAYRRTVVFTTTLAAKLCATLNLPDAKSPTNFVLVCLPEKVDLVLKFDSSYFGSRIFFGKLQPISQTSS